MRFGTGDGRGELANKRFEGIRHEDSIFSLVGKATAKKLHRLKRQRGMS
jgi:hypothetical protein